MLPLKFMTLDQAVEHIAYRILAISHAGSLLDQESARQLQELGFIRGEEVVLLRRTQPGSDPLVVRIGSSTFALRKAEAQCIQIEEEIVHA